MVLKQIITRNIQNHKEVVIDLPPTGFVIFMGDNSNGKSVIVRTTRDLLCNNIKKPQTRYDLVNNKSAYGEIVYVRDDDAILLLHLTREAATTYVSLTLPGKDAVIRYLADKNYMELVKAFGWNVVEDLGISLNIAESDDALFFYKTSPKTNAKALQSATTDPIADNVLEAFKTTVSDARKMRDNAAANARAIQSALSVLEVFDTAPLQEEYDKLEYYYRNLSKLYIPTLPEIKPVPQVHMCSIHTPVIPTIRYPKLFDIRCNLPDILPVTRELQSLRERKCPTCGRGWDCAC